MMPRGKYAAAFVAAGVLVWWASMAPAQSLNLSTKSRSDLFASQVRVLDGRAASQFSRSITLAPPRVVIPGTPEALAAAGSYDGPYLQTARDAAERHGIPQTLFLKLVSVESGWNPAARSRKGAVGLAQLMPQTARRLRVDPRDPVQNLEGGARYLRQMFDRFGSWPLALAAYNAGPQAVERYRGIPPYDETRTYVSAIWGN